MGTDECAVAMARLEQLATISAIGEARRWAQAFAAEHGMGRREQADVAVAVSEAVTNVVRHAYPEGAVGGMSLAAATDGEWLTVRVDDSGPGAESASLGAGIPLMTALSDRIEVTAGPDGLGTRVLMEFPMRPTEGGIGCRAVPTRFARRAIAHAT